MLKIGTSQKTISTNLQKEIQVGKASKAKKPKKPGTYDMPAVKLAQHMS